MDLQEGTTTFESQSDEHISKEMPVFYNPVMKLNRDLTLLVLASIDWLPEGEMRIGLPMEASGIRAARIMNELVSRDLLKPRLISVNDLSPEAIEFAKKNVEKYRGEFSKDKVEFSTNEANMFLRNSRGFEYIDIDPFGTPNPFLDSAVKRISRDGILAVTATDTSALAGTYPKATAKKYWSVPSRTWAMHEWGIRILIRKVQLVGAQYDKVLVPVLSVSKDHYYRIFFRCVRGNNKLSSVFSQHRYVHVNKKTMELSFLNKNFDNSPDVEVAGPMWMGPLHDGEFVEKMLATCDKMDATTFHDARKLLSIIKEETEVDTVGFLELNELFSRLKLPTMKKDEVLEILGKHASRTHFHLNAIKTDLFIDKLILELENH